MKKLKAVLMNPRLLNQIVRRPGSPERYQVTYIGSSFIILKKFASSEQFEDDFVLDCKEALGDWLLDEDQGFLKIKS